jgi:hypothetical protein
VGHPARAQLLGLAWPSLLVPRDVSRGIEAVRRRIAEEVSGLKGGHGVRVEVGRGPDCRYDLIELWKVAANIPDIYRARRDTPAGGEFIIMSLRIVAHNEDKLGDIVLRGASPFQMRL